MAVKANRHLVAADDGWGVGGHEYSEAEFITRSTDHHGHFRHMRVNVPPEVAARVEAIVATKTIPAYRTGQDLIRDAIMHRLHWLEERIEDPELARVLANERRRSSYSQAKQEIEELTQLVADAETVLALQAKAKDWWALSASLEEIAEHANEIRQPYAGRMAQLAKSYRVTFAKELATKDDTHL